MNYYTNSASDLSKRPPTYRDSYQPYPVPNTSYPSRPPSYPYYHTTSRSYMPRYPPDSYSRSDANRPIEQKNYYDHSAYNYSTTPRNYSTQIIKDEIPEESDVNTPSNQSSQYTPSPRQRYRSPEDYHYDYRGGYRPSVDSESRDGYTTDGSGSGYREARGSSRGYENYRYPEREALIPRDRGHPFGSQTTYAKDSSITRLSSSTYSDGAEKQPFIGGVEPVRLTPSWEQRNVSKEELNFKNVKTYENFEVDAAPPRDKLWLVFLVLVLHGIGTLMPWNMFITAKNYFVDFKLNAAEGLDTKHYSTNFLTYVGYAAQIPNVLFNWINIFVQFSGGETVRIVGSILTEVVIFIVTVVLAMLDSSSWPGAFFWATMASVVILNIAAGTYQNTIYGLAARLPSRYTGAVVLGSNISGTLTSLIMIAAIALAPNQRTSAIYYFITALFILLACFDTYFALPLNRFYRYHMTKHQKKAMAAERTPGKVRTPYWYIFKKSFPQLFNVFMVFFVTLAVFPSVLADICRTEENFFIPDEYFQAVTCFLTFNLFAMIGNMLPGLFMWPGPRFLCIPVLLRLLFIPAFLLCHYYPYQVERVMPVFIDSDYAYWSLAILLGLTSGYYSSLAMMYCPRTVEDEHAPVAGMFGAASLITGIFAGVLFQIVCSWSVTHMSFNYPDYADTFRNCTNRPPGS